MKLTLLRHAKAVPALSGIDDHARPLNERGRRAAGQVGIETAGARPDLVLCSTAARTRETWAILSQAWDLMPPALMEEALYLAEPEALLRRLRRLSPDVGHVWLIGHNPGLHDLANRLAQTADGIGPVGNFPTAARARIEFDGAGWNELGHVPVRWLDLCTPERD
ncbi:MAG TPA: histidine phosphatase family protein [Aliidongia sp.]|uniref:SixA phosphatase family protein n=1 Tax=Aliidongia sp. TaxID=1914230 RepID=UPI002DDD5576|nr:histidine phosphatase family protein [Aliidongia sp.]HEV2675911.1 histidine phosphatase family protein [Aliidongia sp.]